MAAATMKLSLSRSGSLGRSSSTMGSMRASEQSERSRRRYRSLRRRNDLNDNAISTRHTAFRNRKSDALAGRSRDRKPFVAKVSVCMASLRSGMDADNRAVAMKGRHQRVFRRHHHQQQQQPLCVGTGGAIKRRSARGIRRDRARCAVVRQSATTPRRSLNE